MIDGVIALYIFMLAAFTGYEVISRVPVILHTPLMSGSNFVHGIVLVGAMVALATADTTLVRTIGFVGVVLAAAIVATLQMAMTQMTIDPNVQEIVIGVLLLNVS